MRPDDAATAAACGAAYLGVVFAPSKRRVAVDRGRLILDGASGSAARRVGVFGTSSAADILQTAVAAHLDVLQLHGEFDRSTLSVLRRRFPGQLWGVVRVSAEGTTVGDWARWDSVDALVVDTWSRDALGGTGVPFDWEGSAKAIAAVRGRRTIVLAGGLTPDNVATGIATLAPNVVDVSSGVERVDGEKDPARVAAFVRAARGEGT
jgi:phosphoribosylanthranilate isomerase